MNAAGALDPPLGRSLVIEVTATAGCSPRASEEPPSTWLELERLQQPARLPWCGGRRRAPRGSPAAPARHAPRGGRRSAAGRATSATSSSGVEPLRVGEDEPFAAGARTRCRWRPGARPRNRAPRRRRRRQTIRWTILAPGTPRRRAGVLEEGEVGAGIPRLVGEEQVVDGRVVLVDGFLDQPQSHHADVEVDVALGVLGDRGDVVNPLELMGSSYTIRR